LTQATAKVSYATTNINSLAIKHKHKRLLSLYSTTNVIVSAVE